MKLSVGLVSLALALSSTAINAAVVGHGGHQHKHRRDYGNPEVYTTTSTITRYITVVYDDAEVPIPTVTQHGVYKAEAHRSTTPTTTTTESSTTTESTTTTHPSYTPTSAPSTGSDVEVSSSGDGSPDCDFPDGEVSCNTFPSAYGAVPVSWMKFGGWSGIQINGGAGDKCVDGALCSYACPPGYSKSQWPDDQPASGESHGGLLCRDGKLYKTRPQNSSLCIKGKGGVFVKNELGEFVPICRTDYPGTENMVIPLSCTPGSVQELTVPISQTYYVWEGKQTSAQYYVNPKGTSLEDGCVWGQPGGGKGNWSPMIFGAGFSDGIAWLSISQNQLNSSPLGYNVRIVAGPDSELNGKCKYENGQFSGGGYGEQGCTAALKSGTAYFELYN